MVAIGALQDEMDQEQPEPDLLHEYRVFLFVGFSFRGVILLLSDSDSVSNRQETWGERQRRICNKKSPAGIEPGVLWLYDMHLNT